MKVTPRASAILAYRRQKRDLEHAGWEEIGEGGGKLWELYRGYRYNHQIVDCQVVIGGMSVFVKIVKNSEPNIGA